MTVPNQRERQFMQELRSAGWVKATTLPEAPRVIANLLARGWIMTPMRIYSKALF
jgi:hypothetical protein